MSKCLFSDPLFNFDKLIRGKNINFLIGSGASAKVYSTLSMSENLKALIFSDNNKNKSFEDIISSEDVDQIKKNFLYLYFYHELISKMFITKKEDAKDKGINEKTFEEVLELYKDFIKKLFIFLQNESNERPKRINIFTTNYDLFFELAYDEIFPSIPFGFFNDGSRGIFNKRINIENFYLNANHSGFNDEYKYEVPTLNLLKIHGSISWDENEQKILQMKKYSEISNPPSKLKQIYDNLVSNSSIKEILSYLSKKQDDNTLRDKFDSIFKDHEIKNKLNDFNEEYAKLSIINPDKSKFYKTIFWQHHYQILRSFSYELEKKQTILIVFGFSFADEHIRSIIKRSLSNPELTVYVLPFDKNDYNNIKDKYNFKIYNNFKFLICHQDECKEKKNNGDFEFVNRELFNL